MKTLMIRLTKTDNGQIAIDAGGSMNIGDVLVGIELYKKQILDNLLRGGGSVNIGSDFDERIKSALNVK